MLDGGTAKEKNPLAIRGDSAAVETLIQADPTGKFGVGVWHARVTGATDSAIDTSDQHVVALQLSKPIGVDVRIGSGRLHHRPGRGSIGICPAGVDSAAEVHGSVDLLIIRVFPECLSLATAQLGGFGGGLVERMCGRDDGLFSIGQTLRAEAGAGHPNGILYWSAAADALIQHLANHHLSRAIPAVPPRDRLTGEEFGRLDEFIRVNLAEPLDIPGLAAVVGCERFRFAHRFRRAVGVSPHRYVMRRRLERARALIRTGREPLSQIALATGFFDQAHLCHWMRRVYNLRPKDLRSDRQIGRA